MKDRVLQLLLVVAASFGMAMAHGQSGVTATMNIQAARPGVVISSNLFGIFFEEINSAGDGGIYAELVRNRSFEDASNSPAFWSFVSDGTATGQMVLDTSLPMSPKNPHSLALTMTGGSGSVGAANNGYWGIPVTNGATYNLQFYARGASGFSGDITVSLESTNGGTIYARHRFRGVTTDWQHFTASLVSTGTDTNAQLVVRISQTGTVYLDFVSLFPAKTFHDRPNGLRPDLANMLVNLKPSFMRFPGGSWVDGIDLSNAYHWEPTVGFLPDRAVRTNIWGYMVDNGLGYQEYLQMSEDLGAEPLFDVNVGMAGGSAVAPENLGPWVQEALNAIQYANGGTNTTYGAMRAANGHPAPFNLKYIEIGNENGGSAYNTNYAIFYDAIKSNYPSMHIIANDWGGIPTSRPVEIQDEHYYHNAAWFEQNATKYDSYDRNGPKVFVGEYAVAYNIGPGFLATLNNALGEASFMTGIERNSDIVEMACYAPLFANWNNQDWTPDLIYFNGTQAYGTPSYYVQEMFAQNRGDVVLPTAVSVNSDSSNFAPHGAIGVGSWNTAVQYTNIVVTSNGVTLYRSDFAGQGTNGWRVYNGDWSTSAGLYQQTSSSTTDCRSTFGSTNWANYTITLRARKTGGSEGFLILFNWQDDNNWLWWNIGGWNNTLDAVQQNYNGTKTVLSQISQPAISNNVWYNIRVELDGTNVSCYLNGSLVQTVGIPAPTAAIYASSSLVRSSHEILVKAVNPSGVAIPTTFHFPDVGGISPNASVVQLTSASPDDLNSFADPTKVSPVTNMINYAGTNFTFTLPANSFSILRLQATNINAVTNLTLQVPSPIDTARFVPSVITGQLASGEALNLNTNSDYGIKYSSSDTSVAVVDADGNVTGVGAGTAQIIATYAALGLSATQSVQVVSAMAVLVHRYSFSETSGTNVADSVGGPAWAGTLPNGGSFSGGQLTLSAANSQFVKLPPDILSNYAAVTIECWATFGTLPGNCFLYGFGDKNGSDGVDYIFCQPKDGRVAISDSNWTGEQGTGGAGNWSGQTVHVTALFNPPAGYVALYTNGVLVSMNSAVTVPFTSVKDVYSYIGRSLYSSDSYLDMSVDEFRIYDGALTPAQIAATDKLGPQVVLNNASPSLGASVSGDKLTLEWPPDRLSWILQMQTNSLLHGLTTNWQDVQGSDTLTAVNFTISQTNPAVFYRLRRP